MIPDNVEKIIITKEDYERNVEQLLVDKCKAELEVERLQNIIKEVRKIFKYYGDRGDIENYSTYFITGEALIRIYELLDKENKQ